MTHPEIKNVIFIKGNNGGVTPQGVFEGEFFNHLCGKTIDRNDFVPERRNLIIWGMGEILRAHYQESDVISIAFSEAYDYYIQGCKKYRIIQNLSFYTDGEWSPLLKRIIIFRNPKIEGIDIFLLSSDSLVKFSLNRNAASVARKNERGRWDKLSIEEIYQVIKFFSGMRRPMMLTDATLDSSSAVIQFEELINQFR